MLGYKPKYTTKSKNYREETENIKKKRQEREVAASSIQGISFKRNGLSGNKMEGLIGMNTMLCNATATEANRGKDTLNADKAAIAIDSCCSYSVANRKEDFNGPMKTCNMTIQGFSRKSRVTKIGTCRFSLKDEDGMTHVIEIPNTNAPFIFGHHNIGAHRTNTREERHACHAYIKNMENSFKQLVQ